MQDRAPMCIDCIEDHALHQLIPVSGLHIQLARLLGEAEGARVRLRQASDSIESVGTAVQKQTENIREEINSFCETLMKSIALRRDQLLEQLGTQSTTKRLQLEIQRTQYQEAIKSLSSTMSALDSALRRADIPTAILNESKINVELSGAQKLLPFQPRAAADLVFIGALPTLSEAMTLQQFDILIDHCEVHSDTLDSIRPGVMNSIEVTVKDRKSQPCLALPPRVFSLDIKGELMSLPSGEIKSEVKEKNNGIYSLTFRLPPIESSEAKENSLQIAVSLLGRPLPGSPFSVPLSCTAEGKYIRTIYGEEYDELSHPNYVAANESVVVISDFYNHRLMIWNKENWAFDHRIGDYGTSNGMFNSPSGLSLSGTEIYVADFGNNRIQVLDVRDGKFLRKFGTFGDGDGQLTGPIAIVASSDEVFVIEQGNHRVSVFDRRDGKFIRRFGRQGDGRGLFLTPCGIALAGDRIYVVDRGNHRVQALTLQGEPLFVIGGPGTGQGQLNGPTDAVILGTELLVVDHGNTRICVFEAKSGKYLRSWGTQGSEDGELDGPWGIATAGAEVIIVDQSSNRFQVFR